MPPKQVPSIVYDENASSSQQASIHSSSKISRPALAPIGNVPSNTSTPAKSKVTFKSFKKLLAIYCDGPNHEPQLQAVVRAVLQESSTEDLKTLIENFQMALIKNRLRLINTQLGKRIEEYAYLKYDEKFPSQFGIATSTLTLQDKQFLDETCRKPKPKTSNKLLQSSPPTAITNAADGVLRDVLNHKQQHGIVPIAVSQNSSPGISPRSSTNMAPSYQSKVSFQTFKNQLSRYVDLVCTDPDEKRIQRLVRDVLADQSNKLVDEELDTLVDCLKKTFRNNGITLFGTRLELEMKRYAYFMDDEKFAARKFQITPTLPSAEKERIDAYKTQIAREQQQRQKEREERRIAAEVAKKNQQRSADKERSQIQQTVSQRQQEESKRLRSDEHQRTVQQIEAEKQRQRDAGIAFYNKPTVFRETLENYCGQSGLNLGWIEWITSGAIIDSMFMLIKYSISNRHHIEAVREVLATCKDRSNDEALYAALQRKFNPQPTSSGKNAAKDVAEPTPLNAKGALAETLLWYKDYKQRQNTQAGNPQSKPAQTTQVKDDFKLEEPSFFSMPYFLKPR